MENSVSFKEAKTTIICKKAYSQELDMNRMSEDIKNRFYKTEPIPTMFIGEVIDIIEDI